MTPHDVTDGVQEEREGGYTLVESVVALALLLTVLIPLAAALAFLSIEPRSQRQIEALARAQNALEAAIAADPRTLASGTEQDGAWRVERTVRHDGELAVVTVAVARDDSTDALVTLTTARLVLPEEEGVGTAGTDP